MTFQKFFTPAFLLIAALFVFAGTADAADISLFIGAELPGSVDNDGVKTPLGNGPVYGVRLGNNFMRYLGTEHTLALSSDYLFPGENTSVEEAKGFLYSSNLVLNFPDINKKMIPFLTAGAGLIHQYGDRDLPVGTKFAFNYGGGLKFPNLAGPLGARVDLRGYRAGLFSKKLNIFELSFGVMVSFGR